MSGETDQVRLQKLMAPELRPETYVYCTFQDHCLPVDFSPICTFRESEGLVQMMVFGDVKSFDHWCEVEPLRFEDGLLFSKLVREGHAAFADHR